MSDTPETDRATVASGGDWSPVLRETCRRLERERNDARADLEFRRGLYKVQEQHLETARRERDEAQESARRWQKVASAFEILTPPVGARRIMKLAHRDGWRCAYCGVETSFTGRDGPRATVDHVVPKSKGGLSHLANCVVACQACNNAKGDQEEWSPPEVDEPKAEIPQDGLAERPSPCWGEVAAMLPEAQKTWVWEDGKFRKKKHEE
jgi:5-methylcytosine-specific restriction endonuclease McrA